MCFVCPVGLRWLKLSFLLQVAVRGDSLSQGCMCFPCQLRDPVAQTCADPLHAAGLWIHVCVSRVPSVRLSRSVHASVTFRPCVCHVLSVRLSVPWCPPSPLAFTLFLPPLPKHRIQFPTFHSLATNLWLKRGVYVLAVEIKMMRGVRQQPFIFSLNTFQW